MMNLFPCVDDLSWLSSYLHKHTKLLYPTGTIKFATDTKVKWCGNGDDELAVFVDRSPSAVLRDKLVKGETEKCSELAYSYAKGKNVFIEIQGLQQSEAVFSTFFYKYSQDGGETWKTELDPKAFQVTVKTAAWI